jgi:hypothetical protein
VVLPPATPTRWKPRRGWWSQPDEFLSSYCI